MEQQNKKILIVEDDEFLRSLTAKRLESEGYAVKVAIDGQMALDMLAEDKPDLILLDLLLPNMNGFELLEKMRAEDWGRELPVIVFSNLGQKEDIERAKQLGANDFLIKANFTLEDVISKLHNFLG